MLLLISLNLDNSNAKALAHKYFSDSAIDRAFRQNSMSRETVILLTPDQFLKLAAPGHSEDKEKGVKLLISKGIKFDDLPFLGVETLENGDVEVTSNGKNHEGRHRVRALKELGATLLPIRVRSGEYGPSYCYRWGQRKDRPKHLIGYNGYSIPFPTTETY